MPEEYSSFEPLLTTCLRLKKQQQIADRNKDFLILLPRDSFLPPGSSFYCCFCSCRSSSSYTTITGPESGKVVVFEKKWLYSGKNGFLQVKVVVFEQDGFI